MKAFFVTFKKTMPHGTESVTARLYA
jgi:hypothetical protein